MVSSTDCSTIGCQLGAAVPQGISALIGGLIAFGVSLATNRSSNSRLREQFALERASSSAKERRAKGEELFVLLHYWTSSVAGHGISMGMAMQGKLTINQVLDLDIKSGQEFRSKYEAPRIELYIHSYFPSCSNLHVDLLALLREVNEIDGQFRALGDFEGIRYQSVYVDTLIRFDRAADALKDALICELRKI